MSLKQQLLNDYKEAMKSGNQAKKETVNLVRAAIKQREVDKRVVIEDDAEIVSIIKKQVKMRTDALDDFVKAGRDDLIEAYNNEIEVLKAYLPEEMSYDAVLAEVKKIAEDSGLERNMKSMGAMMKSVMAELKDKADGSMVSKAVKDYLSGKDE